MTVQEEKGGREAVEEDGKKEKRGGGDGRGQSKVLG